MYNEVGGGRRRKRRLKERRAGVVIILNRSETQAQPGSDKTAVGMNPCTGRWMLVGVWACGRACVRACARACESDGVPKEASPRSSLRSGGIQMLSCMCLGSASGHARRAGAGSFPARIPGASATRAVGAMPNTGIHGQRQGARQVVAGRGRPWQRSPRDGAPTEHLCV